MNPFDLASECRRYGSLVVCTGAILLWSGCSDTPASECTPPAPTIDTVGATLPGSDVLAPTRLLRRAALVLRGAAPTDVELSELLASGDSTAQNSYVDGFIDRTLQDPKFYRTMFELARDWLNVPLIPPTETSAEYGQAQQRMLKVCAGGTVKAGSLYFFRDLIVANGEEDPCDGLTNLGAPVAEVTVEPWWAPGKQAKLVGDAAKTSAQCGSIPMGVCGCGPNASRCRAPETNYPGIEQFLQFNPNSQRRQLSEEPARLFAHIAWYDRPATDLIAGTYSVGSTNVQAAYVMQGIEGGATTLVSDDSWWRPSKFAGAPADPEHPAGDPNAWREFSVPDRNPFLIASRNYHYDPRTDAPPMQGLPASGMLTSPGFLSGLPRERIRAARALENLACEVFSPPASNVTFNPYVRDPYNEGPCQHCHKRLDPAAIHFKRWGKQGAAQEGWGAKYLMPDIGAAGAWRWPKVWRTGAFPYHSEPFSQWNRWYLADTGLTPISQAMIDAKPETVFIDFLVPEQSLLGQKSDGTVGPLGFAKLIIAAGSFDRCVVRRIHTAILGRDIDPAQESGYLDALTQNFVSGGRKVRPFVKALTKTELFRRGF
mgnify:CR=1 FL=1